MVDIRRAEKRFHTKIGWLDSWHSFSFGNHYDPDNTRFGLLLVSNDDTVQPATGFGTHPHDNMEIVTWVLSGEIEHKDSAGNHGVIYPGLAQRMSAGSGIFHSEMNPSKKNPVRLIQMWVPPDTEGLKPGYEQKDINPELSKGGLVAIASGQGHKTAVKIHQKDAVLWGGRLKPDETVKVPDSKYCHIFVAVGSATLGGSSSGSSLQNPASSLEAGDAVRLTNAKSTHALSLQIMADAKSGAEVLIWEMN